MLSRVWLQNCQVQAGRALNSSSAGRCSSITGCLDLCSDFSSVSRHKRDGTAEDNGALRSLTALQPAAMSAQLGVDQPPSPMSMETPDVSASFTQREVCSSR
jgi:hypothetical protein